MNLSRIAFLLLGRARIRNHKMFHSKLSSKTGSSVEITQENGSIVTCCFQAFTLGRSRNIWANSSRKEGIRAYGIVTGKWNGRKVGIDEQVVRSDRKEYHLPTEWKWCFRKKKAYRLTSLGLLDTTTSEEHLEEYGTRSLQESSRSSLSQKDDQRTLFTSHSLEKKGVLRVISGDISTNLSAHRFKLGLNTSDAH